MHVVGLMLAVAVATHVGRRDGVPTSLALLAGAAGAWSLLRHPAGAGLARPGTLAAALTGLTGLGILWADDRLAVADTTLSRVGAMAIGVAAAAIAARPGGLRWASRGIQLGGAIVALTALAAELGAEVGRWGQTVSGRVQSVYADPNFLAQALVAVAVVSLNSFTIERRGWRLVAGVASLSSLEGTPRSTA